jgi:hypothetical protein
MPDNNAAEEISLIGKWIAGFLLIFFSFAAILFIVAYWPDRIPGPREGIKPLYINAPFHVRLAGIPEAADTGKVKAKMDTGKGKAKADSATIALQDSVKKKKDSIGKTDTVASAPASSPGSPYAEADLINLNVLLLGLVAVAGFLGNMIHIATSFTTFVGAKSFKKSWILWYTVKPVTAAALAVTFYFVLRGGFLNFSADAAGLNLYGVLTVAILAGLFTDRATLKLAEVFDVVFSIKKDPKSSDNRPDTLVQPQFKFTAVTPDRLSRNVRNVISITGENFDKGKLSFKINDTAIAAENLTITATAISIQYTIPAELAAVQQLTLVVTDEKNKQVFTKVFEVG